MTGEWPKNLIDHDDWDPSNNRWINLFDRTNSENLRNQPLRVTGVCKLRTGKFMAYIKAPKGQITLGTFGTLPEAAAVRRAANLKYGYSEKHGEAR